MQLIRQICQADYPAPANKTACVLTCLQMIIEWLTKSAMDQKSFYNLLLARKIIRPDAYINSYDDALRLILLQISAAAAVVNPAIIKAITENMVQWQFSTDEAPQVIPCVAFIGGHAVLVVDVVKAESGDIDIKVIDPARRGASARYVIPRERVKKFGGFV